MPSFEELLEWLRVVRLVHHIRGRVRLKLSALPDLPGPRLDKAGARRVQGILEGMRGIRSLRVNPLALSCTVEYDPEVIPDQAWTDFIAGHETRQAALLGGLLQEAYQEILDAQP